ncbi:MAG: recombination protein NinG [Georgfuchsia sp.]
MRKCKTCGTRYEPTMRVQTACSVPCAIEQAKVARVKKEAKEDREKKLKLKPRAQWMREAQAVFNRFIRARDAGQPCISCGRHHPGQIHAGHYMSTGARPELRFDERNVHAQCAPCNNHLSGNIALYRAGLIAKIGLPAVESLEGQHEPKKYSIDELREIKAIYTQKLKQLQP